MFFRKDPPQTEGRRYTHLLIKTPPVLRSQNSRWESSINDKGEKIKTDHVRFFTKTCEPANGDAVQVGVREIAGDVRACIVKP